METAGLYAFKHIRKVIGTFLWEHPVLETLLESLAGTGVVFVLCSRFLA